MSSRGGLLFDGSRPAGRSPGSPVPLGFLVSGRGSNLEAILAAVERGELPAEPRLVLSDRAGVRALEVARAHGVPAQVLERREFPDREAYERALAGRFLERGVELCAMAGFLRLVGTAFLEALGGRVTNVHPSLLPAFPGLEAQRQALEYGVRVAGCTVHFVDEEMDHGPIILQAAVPVLDEDTPESLADRILREEHRIYPEAIRLYALDRLRIRGRRVLQLPET
ncbi:MAG: phosphoribosylglycinamide formyltransferase [Bacillota bacterium]|nr:phosphoribosylglycinamide formyltransferase [Bacillota bacterium]